MISGFLFAFAAATQPSVGEPVLIGTRRIPQVTVRSESVPVRIRVSARGRLLFDDVLRVARNSGASYQQYRNEAAETVCAERYSNSQDRNTLSINLGIREEPPMGPSVSVSVNWQRPSEDDICGDGTRTVQLSQTVPLAPGQSATIQGDAGLTVTLSR
jgi:hypothetical protein